MSQIKQLGAGAIWICGHCHIWWGSQIDKRPSTRLLTQLDKAGLLPPWDAYRGWKLIAKQASVCMECGRNINLPAVQSN